MNESISATSSSGLGATVATTAGSSFFSGQGGGAGLDGVFSQLLSMLASPAASNANGQALPTDGTGLPLQLQTPEGGAQLVDVLRSFTGNTLPDDLLADIETNGLDQTALQDVISRLERSDIAQMPAVAQMLSQFRALQQQDDIEVPPQLAESEVEASESDVASMHDAAATGEGIVTEPAGATVRNDEVRVQAEPAQSAIRAAETVVIQGQQRVAENEARQAAQAHVASPDSEVNVVSTGNSTATASINNGTSNSAAPLPAAPLPAANMPGLAATSDPVRVSAERSSVANTTAGSLSSNDANARQAGSTSIPNNSSNTLPPGVATSVATEATSAPVRDRDVAVPAAGAVNSGVRSAQGEGRLADTLSVMRQAPSESVALSDGFMSVRPSLSNTTSSDIATRIVNSPLAEMVQQQSRAPVSTDALLSDAEKLMSRLSNAAASTTADASFAAAGGSNAAQAKSADVSIPSAAFAVTSKVADESMMRQTVSPAMQAVRDATDSDRVVVNVATRQEGDDAKTAREPVQLASSQTRPQSESLMRSAVQGAERIADALSADQRATEGTREAVPGVRDDGRSREPAAAVNTRAATEQQSALMQSTYAQLGSKPPVLGSPAWSGALGNQMVWLAAQNSKVAEIQLDPPELGSLQVKIRVGQDQQVSVSFTSPHAAVRDAVEQSLPRLREMLEEQGLDLADSFVSDQSTQQQARDNKEDDAYPNGQGVGGVGTAEDEQPETVHRVSLVDYYV